MDFFPWPSFCCWCIYETTRAPTSSSLLMNGRSSRAPPLEGSLTTHVGKFPSTHSRNFPGCFLSAVLSFHQTSIKVKPHTRTRAGNPKTAARHPQNTSSASSSWLGGLQQTPTRISFLLSSAIGLLLTVETSCHCPCTDFTLLSSHLGGKVTSRGIWVGGKEWEKEQIFLGFGKYFLWSTGIYSGFTWTEWPETAEWTRCCQRHRAHMWLKNSPDNHSRHMVDIRYLFLKNKTWNLSAWTLP